MAFSHLAVIFSVLTAANTQFATSECNSKGLGQKLYPPGGFILSPGYGESPYQPNSFCIWTIEGYPEEMIELEVLHLGLEPSSSCQEECNHDSIEIWEYVQGGINPAEKVATLCGDVPGMRSYRTYSRSLRIKFTSDSNDITGAGFALKYSIVVMNTTVDEFMYYHDNGTILSPGYSTLTFPQGLEWYWYITAPLEHRVQMVIESLNVSIPDKAGECSDEFVRIRDGYEANPGIVRFCGYHDKPVSLQSTGNKISVHFRIVKNFRGYFQISWMFVKDIYECGSVESGSYGLLQSPRGQVFPETYPHYSRCHWNITAASGKKVQLTSTQFDIEESENCQYDKLIVRDGLGDDAKIIGVYCGDSFKSARSSSSQMSVSFTSDSVINKGGFVLSWSAEEDLFKCDFESDSCNMVQPSDDNFDWVVNDGSSPAHEGPRAAEGGDGNHYYIEATDEKTAVNETARILTKPLGVTGRVCVEFIYHMFGKRVGDLAVFSVRGVRSSDFWMASGQQGNMWHQASVSATLSSRSSQIGWRASRSTGFRGYIAIDQIRLYAGECTTLSDVV